MGLLEGKVALVTGAGRGQGRAHAVRLAEEGADIIALDVPAAIRSAPYALATATDLTQTITEVEALDRRIIAVEGDVRSQASLDDAVARGIHQFGQVDILIANAGVWHLAPFWEISDEEWQDIIDINLTGVWHAAKAVAPHFIERRAGSIVMTSSVNGLRAGPNYAHYTAAKHGVLGLMRTVAVELGSYNVRCNAICPGFIDTPMTNWQGAYDMVGGHPGGTRQEMLAGGKHIAALAGQSALSPRVIADAAVWLVSDFAASVTGVDIPVDAGGLLLPGFNHSPVG